MYGVLTRGPLGGPQAARRTGRAEPTPSRTQCAVNGSRVLGWWERGKKSVTDTCELCGGRHSFTASSQSQRQKALEEGKGRRQAQASSVV